MTKSWRLCGYSASTSCPTLMRRQTRPPVALQIRRSHSLLQPSFLRSRESTAPPTSARPPDTERCSVLPCNCSELRGNQQSAAFQEGIETPGPPGPEEGCQGHLAAAARSRTGAAADFTADHQVAQAPFSSVVIRGSLRVGNEDEQLLDVPLNPPAQVSLDGQRVLQERAAQSKQPPFQRQLLP